MPPALATSSGWALNLRLRLSMLANSQLSTCGVVTRAGLVGEAL